MTRTAFALGAAMACLGLSIALADGQRGTDLPVAPAGAGAGGAELSQADLVKQFLSASAVFTAKVKAIEHGQTNSMPPHVFTSITFEGLVMLKGDQPARAGFGFTNVPGSAGIAAGSSVIVAVNDGALLCVADATEDNVAAVKKAIGQATTQADQQALEKLVTAISAKAPKDWTVKVEKGKVAPLYWPQGSGTSIVLTKTPMKDSPVTKEGVMAYFWIMDAGYAGTLKNEDDSKPKPQTDPAREAGKWRGHRVFEKLGSTPGWETLAEDFRNALKATDVSQAKLNERDASGLATLKTAEGLVKAQLEATASKPDPRVDRDELQRRLKNIQAAIAKLEAQSNGLPATGPAGQ